MLLVLTEFSLGRKPWAETGIDCNADVSFRESVRVRADFEFASVLGLKLTRDSGAPPLAVLMGRVCPFERGSRRALLETKMFLDVASSVLGLLMALVLGNGLG